MKKKILLIGVAVLIIIGIILLIKINSEDNLIGKTKVINEVKFSSAKITSKNDKYFLYVLITTNSKDTVKVEDFDATIYDKKGNRIETLTGYIGDIDSNSKKEITIESNVDLSKAYEINYTLRMNND